MIKKFCILSILLCLVSCGDKQNTSKNISTEDTINYILQLPFDLNIISTIKEEITAKIMVIIKEEANIESTEDLPLFFFKKRAAITTYYINDLYKNAESTLLSSLNDIEKLYAPKNAIISSNVDFFGEPKDDKMALIDLVIKIDDQDNNLLNLNKDIKELMHSTNKRYANTHHTNMYNIDKSEKYPYLPHLTVGHLRANYIKHILNNSAESKAIIERIKQRILKEIADLLSGLPEHSKKILFDKISVYDLQKRTFIKNYDFKL